MIEKSYNFALVILSVVVATIGAYVAIEIAQHVRASGVRRRILWSIGGALALGLGIWSMHFVGMLALRLPVLVWYNALLIVVSISCGRRRMCNRVHHLQSPDGELMACWPSPASSWDSPSPACITPAWPGCARVPASRTIR